MTRIRILVGLCAVCSCATGQTTPAEPSATANRPHSYVGTKKCRMCHTAQHKSLLESAKADAWSALKPHMEIEVKRRAGLDVARDYRRDESCLPCHSVGFGRPGGYAIPEKSNAKAKRHANNRQGIGCEACHGPGSGYITVMRDIMHTGRSYHPAELHKMGRRVVDVNVCNECHNNSAVCQVGVHRQLPYDPRVEASDRTGFHAEFPLSHRAKTSESGKELKRDDGDDNPVENRRTK